MTSSSPTPTSSQGIRGIFHEYTLPLSQFVPLGITAEPDGNLWFTEIMQDASGIVQTGKIERITPTGTLSEFSLPSANSSATDIITGPDGNLWFTETGGRNGPSKIGVITPQGKIREFTLPHAILGSITRGPEGVLWFTAFQYGGTGKIARITIAGKISEFPLPTSGYGPISITFGTDHTLWFTEDEVNATHPFGENGKIGHRV